MPPVVQRSWDYIQRLRDQIAETIEHLRRRKVNYQLTFRQPAGQEVLIDLARFCRANDTCFHADPRLHAVLEGRREVFLRITKHLNLSPEQLFQIYSGNQFNIAMIGENDG